MGYHLKWLMAFCICAGMASAMIHENIHADHDHCGDAHEHHHDDFPTHPDDCQDHEDGGPHHRHCCHSPIADRPSQDRPTFVIFHGRLLEISSEHSLIPDEPFFSLDKPPLI
jgi:hypothetical protein